MNKIPIDAFESYVQMGDGRSYDAVAKQYGVNKRSVQRAANRERWPERLKRIVDEAQTRVDEKLIGDIEEMKMRHRKLVRAMASRAAQAIAAHALTEYESGRSISIDRTYASELLLISSAQPPKPKA